jgi:hypothetical protein
MVSYTNSWRGRERVGGGGGIVEQGAMVTIIKSATNRMVFCRTETAVLQLQYLRCTIHEVIRFRHPTSTSDLDTKNRFLTTQTGSPQCTYSIITHPGIKMYYASFHRTCLLHIDTSDELPQPLHAWPVFVAMESTWLLSRSKLSLSKAGSQKSILTPNDVSRIAARVLGQPRWPSVQRARRTRSC